MIGRYMLSGPGQSVTSVFGNGAQDVLPLLVDNVMPTVIIALYIAAVLSAIMSTIDSLLVVSASAITRDYYQQIINPGMDQAKMARMSKNITLILAIIALVISMVIATLSPDRTIFWFVIFGWSGISASFCPMMILSLFWKRYNEKGAIASMISGFLGVPFFKFVAPNIGVVGPYIETLSELPPAFCLSFIVGFLVTFMTSSRESQAISFVSTNLHHNSVARKEEKKVTFIKR